MNGPKKLTTADLDKMTCACDDGDCYSDVLVMHSACHVTKPMWAWYYRDSKALVLKCAECGKFIAEIAVKKGGK